MEYDIPKIGDLRYRVVLTQRLQVPSLTNNNTVDDFSMQQTVSANIVPISTIAFYSSLTASVNTENQVTHRITVRYTQIPNIFWFVLHDSIQPDNTIYRDTYQVRRIMPLSGRQRFLIMDCMLDSHEMLP
jgi:hypothetical protein